MLRVPTYVAPSPIAGVGLFAATDLPANAVIWEYAEGVDWRIAPAELMLFPEPFQSRLRHYLYQEESGAYVLCGDNAKYMNHSDVPNCDDTGGEQTVTMRAIRAGEELTCDYRLFDLEARTFGLSFNEASQPVGALREGAA
jgi:SET domain-containing protein